MTFRIKHAVVLAVATALSACVLTTDNAPEVSATVPQSRPTAPPPAPAVTVRHSPGSRALATYYQRVQSDLLTQGLLRTDGGGPDTPFDAETLTRDFDAIALANEYVRGEGFKVANGASEPVKKWLQPVRVSAEFGRSVPAAQQAQDRKALEHYVQRLSRITNHDMAVTDNDPNFVVLFVGEDDRAQIKPRIKSLVPNVNTASLRIFDTMPRAIHCLVIAFSKNAGGYEYGNAIALIRAEHPDLLRLSCIHEEVAQGMGLGNDSPRARPSIFNDDDEFALLTTHDEMLLKILYDPRLTPGMDAQDARPIVREIATRLTGGPT